MTVKEIAGALAASGIEDASLEARLLVSHFEKITLAEALNAEICKESFTDEALLSAVARRTHREPLAYIIGEVGFYGEDFLVSPACLIPRADTEILVDAAISLLPPGAVFADIGTGSGCIALSVLRHREDLSAIAVDISKDALEIAQRNAARLSLSHRIRFLQADALAPLPEAVLTADAILSNPPYIQSAVIPTLAPELAFEPSLALDGGKDGLLFYRSLLDNCPLPLFLFEIGYDQGDALLSLGRERGFSASVRKDFGGRDRVAILSKMP